MIVLLLILLILNTCTEFLFFKNLIMQNILKKNNSLHHAICSGVRVLLILLGTFLALPLPLLLIGMLLLLFVDIRPYDDCKLMLWNFGLVMHLIFVALLMIVISVSGLFDMDVSFIQSHTVTRVILINIVYFIYNIVGYLLVYCYPRFFWREDYDRSKVTIYTRFLMICVIYQILDTVIITLYDAEAINNILLLSGNILIVFLTFNFLNYNYEFATSEEARREYEESEALLARQYFEKEELKKIGSLDSLTKARNRWEISELMEESIQAGHEIVCVFVDLDGLKKINDTYGHTCGDQMLKRFANASTEILEDKGYLARIGGDEFLLIFWDQEVLEVEEHIKKLQLELLKPEDEKDKVSFSYGISKGEDSVEDFIHQADRQMYLDKSRKQCGVI